MLTLVDDIEVMRETSKTVRSTMSTMPNVIAIFRKLTELKVGTPIYD